MELGYANLENPEPELAKFDFSNFGFPSFDFKDLSFRDFDLRDIDLRSIDFKDFDFGFDRQAVIGGVTAGALLLAGGMFMAFYERDAQLTEMPQRIAPLAVEQPEPELSRAQFSADVDLNAILAAAEAAVPMSIPKSGRPEVYSNGSFGARLLNGGRKLKIHAPYDVVISRTPFVISATNDVISIETDLQVKGHAGLSGTGCKIVKCDRLGVGAKGKARIDIFMRGHDEFNRPRLIVEPHIDVEQARIKLVHTPRIYVDLTGDADAAARDALRGLEKDISAAVGPEAIAGLVEDKAWRQIAAPVVLEDKQVFAVFTPHSVGVSRLTASDGHAQLALAVSGKTEIVPDAPDPSAWNAPVKFEQVEFGESRMSLALPVMIPWQTANEILAKQLPFEAEAGDTVIKVSAAELYPSGDRIALKLRSHIDLPGLFGDVKGDLGLAGRITAKMTKDGPMLMLEDFAFARKVDNVGFSVLTMATESMLIAKAEEAGRIPLAEISQKAKAAADEALSAQARKMGIDAQITDFAVTDLSVTPTAEGLQVFVRVDADFKAKSGQFQIADRSGG